MATKAKPKGKTSKKAARRLSGSAKSIRLKAKATKSVSGNGSRNLSKRTSKTRSKGTAKTARAESRRTSVVRERPLSGQQAAPERAGSKQVSSAIVAYEAGIKLMHGEEFEKAIRCFNDLIANHNEEPEIQERAKVLILACEKKIQERGRTVLRSADDHYNMGIAHLNRRELQSAVEHLQHALKLLPKGDHILYALATASALEGNREEALGYLKQSIQYRGENRFLAARDSDFESLQEDPDFRQLVAPSDK